MPQGVHTPAFSLAHPHEALAKGFLDHLSSQRFGGLRARHQNKPSSTFCFYVSSPSPSFYKPRVCLVVRPLRQMVPTHLIECQAHFAGFYTFAFYISPVFKFHVHSEYFFVLLFNF